MDEISFTCRPWLMEEGDWLEVACLEHGEKPYQCGHHHRRWGPALRCMNRHVKEISGTDD